MIKKFDYKGYTEEKLEKLCEDKYVHNGFSELKYWTSEVYSFGRNIRSYGFYPECLPLHIYSEHGVGLPFTQSHEVDNDAAAMFVFSQSKKQTYTEKSNKPCFVIPAPFVWYRRKNNVNQRVDAKGTLIFPVHSIPSEETILDLNKYIEEIKALPQEFHPVCVCLHMHDINKGWHKIFAEHNIPVYTVGNAFDQRFSQRFYDLLKNFKYTSSNLIGSYTFYSVEMGIPFSLYGTEAYFNNISNDSIPKGIYDISQNEIYTQNAAAFKGLNKTITEEQKKLADHYLGLENPSSRQEIAKVLYMAYLKNRNPIKDCLSAAKKIIKFIRYKIKGRI